MSEPKIETRHILVYGKVQNVGFRKWAEQRAQEAELSGWLRNRPDGRVEVMASGTSDHLKAFEAELSKGPARSEVVRVAVRTVKQRRFQRFGLKATGPKSAETITDIISSLDSDYLAACQNAYDAVPPEGRMLNRFDRKQRNWRFGQIDTAAERCGIDVVHLGPNAPPSLLCREGKFNFGLDVTRPSWVTPLTELLSNNKFLTKILLDGLKVPVPSGEICRTQKEAHAAFKRMQGAVVMKPVFGTEAKGVTLNITTPDACNTAFDYAKTHCSKDLVLVEGYVRGVDLRLLFLGKSLVVAYLRLPAHVVGDGVRSISDLVAEKNNARISLPSTQESQLIKLQLKHRRLLTLQGYAPEDCPKSGRVVLLGVSPNYIDGADLLPITDQLHPDITALAQEAVSAIDPKGFWGVDLLTEDFTKPRSEAKTVLCEVNSRPVGGVFRYATHGKHVHFFEEAFKKVRAAPDAFQSPSMLVPPEESKAPAPDIRDRFEGQVAKVIQENRPSAMFLTPDIAVARKGNKTEFYLLNPNPSFLRGALFPWRWLSLRALLEARGVAMTRLHPPEEFGGQDCTPIGRAFLTRARRKMRTVWIENQQKLSEIRQENQGWDVAVERFETPSSLEVAIIGGAPAKMLRIDYQPLFATGDTDTETLIRRALDQKHFDVPVALSQLRRQLRDPKAVLPLGQSVGQPQAIARLAGVVRMQEESHEDLWAICRDLPTLLPGLTLGTVVFRLASDGTWGLSELRGGIDARPFLSPDVGMPCDLARKQAAFALANPRCFDVALPRDLLHQAAF